jgi:lipoprotein-releasing system ATP-binding protein
MPIISAHQLSKSFKMGDAVVSVLRRCDLVIEQGEFVAIEGRSGSGKSTLLHLLGCLDRPEEGTIQYEGRDIASLGDSDRSAYRNGHFGFVFQFYHLLPELSVLENTLLGAFVKHSSMQWLRLRHSQRDRARQLLDELGLSHRLKHRPSQLSGGERQRVAIARALMNSPKVLYADEPTGNLDTETGTQIMSVLNKLHREGQTLVMVTHDRSLAKQADRTLLLRDGKLVKP